MKNSDSIQLSGKLFRCIDHRPYEMMTSIETVKNIVLSTCFISVACLVLKIVYT